MYQNRQDDQNANQNQDDQDCLFGYFPYRSYEEIQHRRQRHIRRRRSFILLTGLFFAVSVVGINVMLAYGGHVNSIFVATEPVNEIKVNSYSPGVSTQTANPVGESAGKDFSLVISDADGETEAIFVKDVSAIVRRARKSVVGVTCETYSTFTMTSNGSGIIISEDGYIITNNHVIANGDSISVTLDSGESYPAYVIGTDEFTDLAVLKIETEGLEVIEFGDSDLVEAGQAAIAIGNPTGQLQGTVTAGIISAVNRNVVVGSTVMNLIQTDAAINTGNSGGPLLNQYGQVIGVNSAKLGASNGYEGISFAIPFNSVKPIVEQLVGQGYVSGRPLVGVSGVEISKMASAFYSLPQGVMIESINESSPLLAAGGVAGDIIIAVDGQRIYSVSDAMVLRNQYKAGDQMTMTLYRKGQQYEVTLILIEQTTDNADCNF